MPQIDHAALSERPEAIPVRATSESDFDYAAALAQSDQEVVGLIAAHFLDEAPRQMAIMRQAWHGADFEALQRDAHAMMGLLGNFKAVPAQQLAAEIDHESRTSRSERIIRLFDALDQDLARLAPHLKVAATHAALNG